MRIVVTGWDSGGRSTVVRIDDLGDLSAGDEVAPSVVWTTDTWPPVLPVPTSSSSQMAADGPPLDVGCPPEGTIWRLVRMPPDYRFDRHRSQTLDYDVLVSGSLRLELDDGSVDLAPGDCVVLPGVPHAWRAGRAGAVLNVVMTGLGPARESGSRPAAEGRGDPQPGSEV